MAFLRAVKVALRSSWTVLVLHLLFVSSDFSFLILRSVEMVSSTSIIIVGPVYARELEQDTCNRLYLQFFPATSDVSVEYTFCKLLDHVNTCGNKG